MNRYHGINRAATIGGPSKASASTMCQKCLKKDMSTLSLPWILMANSSSRHYSYECKANAQERPYVSRPSRTQQLSNPKLVPKLTSDVPQDLTKKYVFSSYTLFMLSMAQSMIRRTCGRYGQAPGSNWIFGHLGAH